MCQWEEVGSGSSYAAILGFSLFYVVVRGLLILFISENVTEINILTHMDWGIFSVPDSDQRAL